MKNPKAALVALCALLAASLGAQSIFDRLKDGAVAGSYLTAVSTDVIMLVRYTGTNSLGGTVTVDASTGDLSFAVGAVSASAADTTFECPVSGALGGIIDVSDTACNTLGEVVDTINGSGSDFRAVLVAGLRSDLSTNTLITLSETAANAKGGLGLLNDGTVSPFRTTWAILPVELKNDITQYVRQGQATTAPQFIQNPFKGTRTDVWKSILQSTYSSGTSAVSIVLVKPDLVARSEVVTTLWSQAAGATATDQTMDWTTIGGLPGRNDEKVLVRITNSAVMSAATGSAVGVQYRY